MSPAAELLQMLRGWLGASGTSPSLILRVRGGSHWIVIDGITAEGLIAIRDPAATGPEVVTAERLIGMHPLAVLVMSFPLSG